MDLVTLLLNGATIHSILLIVRTGSQDWMQAFSVWVSRLISKIQILKSQKRRMPTVIIFGRKVESSVLYDFYVNSFSINQRYSKRHY